MSTRTLVPLCLLFAATFAFGQDEDDEYSYEENLEYKILVQRGAQFEVEELLRDASLKIGRLIIPDQALQGVKIRFLDDLELNYRLLRAILAMYDVELLHERVGEREIIKAYLQRNLMAREIGKATRIFGVDEELPPVNEVVTAVVHVEYANVEQVFAQIRAMQARDRDRLGNIIYVKGQPDLIITDKAPNVEFYKRIIQAIDQPPEALILHTVKLENALAEEVAALATNIINAKQTVETDRGLAVSAKPQILADRRTNKVIIFALEKDVNELLEMIEDLDVEVDPPESTHYVVHLVNADAVEIADKLNELFTGVSTGSSSSSRTRGRTNTSQPPISRPSPAATSGSPSDAATLTPAQADIPTRIVANEPTNTLIIQARPEEYESILEIIAELDKKRTRVFIEAQVWEVTVSNDFQFGVELATIDNAHPGSTRGLGLTDFGLSTLTAGTDADGNVTNVGRFPGSVGLAGPSVDNGLTFALTRGAFDQLPLIIQALGADTRANLLTTPFAVTNDGEEATFSVSQNEPFRVTNSTSAVASSGFEYATAESFLTIQPRVSSDETLTLDVELEIETFTASAGGDGAPPPSSSRRYQGIVTVPNNRYVVFGGLEQVSDTESVNKVPLLGDIPIIGYLFKRVQQRQSRTRIYIFIRPIIFSSENFERTTRASKFLRDRIRSASLHAAESAVLPPDVVEKRWATVQGQINFLFNTVDDPFSYDAGGAAERRRRERE